MIYSKEIFLISIIAFGIFCTACKKDQGSPSEMEYSSIEILNHTKIIKFISIIYNVDTSDIIFNPFTKKYVITKKGINIDQKAIVELYSIANEYHFKYEK